MWQQWINFILGLWVIAVPFIGFTGGAMVYALVVTGIVIAALGLWGALYEQSSTHREEVRHQTA
jgi:hypothetical protein